MKRVVGRAAPSGPTVLMCVICYVKSFSRIRRRGTARLSHPRAISFSFGRPGKAFSWTMAAYWSAYWTVMIPLSILRIRRKRGPIKGRQGAEMDQLSAPKPEQVSVRSYFYASLRFYPELHLLLILRMRRNNTSTVVPSSGSSFAPRT